MHTVLQGNVENHFRRVLKLSKDQRKQKNLRRSAMFSETVTPGTSRLCQSSDGEAVQQ